VAPGHPHRVNEVVPGQEANQHRQAGAALRLLALTAPDHLFAQIVHIIEEGGWAVFRNMPLIFAVGPSR
jgi:hypothetical protein